MSGSPNLLKNREELVYNNLKCLITTFQNKGHGEDQDPSGDTEVARVSDGGEKSETEARKANISLFFVDALMKHKILSKVAQPHQ